MERRGGAALTMAACGAAVAGLQATSAFVAGSSLAPSRSMAALPRAASARAPGGAQAPLAPESAVLVGLGLGALGARAAGRRATQRRATNIGGAGDIEDAVPFELRGFSLSTVVLGAGVLLLVLTGLDYGLSIGGGGSGIGALLLIYSVPVFLLGLALLYAQLDPVPVEVKPGAEGVFEKKATATLLKVKSDVTRHRYGDDAHLDTSLKALGLTGKGRYPQLRQIYEDVTPEGELEFIMHFESRDVPFTTWSSPIILKACDRFFGPGIWSEVKKVSSKKKVAELKLTTGLRPKDKQIGDVGGVVTQKVEEA